MFMTEGIVEEVQGIGFDILLGQAESRDMFRAGICLGFVRRSGGQAPHVRPMAVHRTCVRAGGADESELTAIHGLFYCPL